MPRHQRPTPSAGRKRERVLVDSGAWIALIRARDNLHPRADAMFRRAVRERTALITTNVIVAEVYRFLLFHAGKRPADAFLERLDASPRLTLEFLSRQHHQRAREWLARLDDQIISYTDATSFAAMELAHCDAVLSFDHDFVVAGFRVWG